MRLLTCFTSFLFGQGLFSVNRTPFYYGENDLCFHWLFRLINNQWNNYDVFWIKDKILLTFNTPIYVIFYRYSLLLYSKLEHYRWNKNVDYKKC